MSGTTGTDEATDTRGGEVAGARVLFVCTANISRSPFAEHAARELVDRQGLEVRVASAGTHGWDAHPVDVEMAAELDTRNLDHTGFRSRRLAGEHVQQADLVLTMEAAQRTYVLQEWPAAVRRVYTLGQLARALPSVDDSLTGVALLKEIRRVQPAARAEDDIADPYGRGAEAAATAAGQIEQLLARVVPTFPRMSE